MTWEVAWTIVVFFVATRDACRSNNAYLQKAFECSPEMFVRRQWHYDLQSQLPLECSKEHHVWVYTADVATQSHESLCVTSLLNKKCAGRSQCLLSREHFLDKVSANWIKHSAVLKIVFACVDRDTSGLMMLHLLGDLPNPCERHYTHKPSFKAPPQKLRQQAREGKSSNLTMKFAEILWVQGQISRNREKTTLYVAIGVTVGIIFLLMAFIFYKTTVKVPVPARVVNLSGRHNISKNNNQCCHLKNKAERECLLPKEEQVRCISNVNLIVHQHGDGSICYLVEPANKHQSQESLDSLRPSYVVPISQALLLQQKQQMLNLQQHNHHYHHHHHPNQDNLQAPYSPPQQCIYADIVQHLLHLHHPCPPTHPFQQNKHAIYNEHNIFNKAPQLSLQQPEAYQKQRQFNIQSTSQPSHHPPIQQFSIKPFHQPSSQPPHHPPLQLTHHPPIQTPHHPPIQPPHPSLLQPPPQQQSYRRPDRIYNSLESTQTLDITPPPNLHKYLLKPTNDEALMQPQTANTAKPTLREVYYRHNTPQSSSTMRRQNLQSQGDMQGMKHFNATLPTLKTRQEFSVDNYYHNANIYNNENEEQKRRVYDIGSSEVISAITPHQPCDTHSGKSHSKKNANLGTSEGCKECHDDLVTTPSK